MFEAPSYNNFRDILMTSSQWPNLQRAITDKPKAICPFNFSKVGGVINVLILTVVQYSWIGWVSLWCLAFLPEKKQFWHMSKLKHLKQRYLKKRDNILTLNVPIATKVVCFSRLLECLRSLYGKQCGPRSDCSYRSSLFWVHAVCFYT